MGAHHINEGFNDWGRFFVHVVRAMWTGVNPYTDLGPAGSDPFVNPPWLWLPLAPLFWVLWWLAMAILPLVLLWLAYRDKNIWLILIVGTSWSFISLSAYAGPDWVAWVGVALGGPVGLLLNSAKPQIGIFSIFAELGDLWRARDWQNTVKLFMPVAIIGGAMTLLYPMWIGNMFSTTDIAGDRNLAPFPWLLPLGGYFIWRAWRTGEKMWGVAATACIAPYFLIYSPAPLIYFVARKNWKWGLALNAASWAVFILAFNGIIDRGI
ncbi:MAG: hypothetical protein AAF787_02885 [Chloroflexota bacterium]